MYKNFFYTLLIITLFLFSHCGRKKKYPFSFKTKKTTPSIEMLDLPSIKGVTIKKEKKGKKTSWKQLEKSALQKLSQRDTVFVGYNVYRLTNYGFVPKTPLNKKPLSRTEFFDKQTLVTCFENRKQKQHQKASYVVRAIFKVNKKIILGPLSRIITCE